MADELTLFGTQRSNLLTYRYPVYSVVLRIYVHGLLLFVVGVVDSSSLSSCVSVEVVIDDDDDGENNGSRCREESVSVIWNVDGSIIKDTTTIQNSNI